MIAISAAICPMMSFHAITRFIFLIIYAFLHEMGIPFENEAICTISPCRQTVRNYIYRTSAEILAMVRVKIKNRCVFFPMKAVNKGDLRHMVKMMAFWDFYEDELMVHNIDSDACVGKILMNLIS